MHEPCTYHALPPKRCNTSITYMWITVIRRVLCFSFIGFCAFFFFPWCFSFPLRGWVETEQALRNTGQACSQGEGRWFLQMSSCLSAEKQGCRTPGGHSYSADPVECPHLPSSPWLWVHLLKTWRLLTRAGTDVEKVGTRVSVSQVVRLLYRKYDNSVCSLWTFHGTSHCLAGHATAMP